DPPRPGAGGAGGARGAERAGGDRGPLAARPSVLALLRGDARRAGRPLQLGRERARAHRRRGRRQPGGPRVHLGRPRHADRGGRGGASGPRSASSSGCARWKADRMQNTALIYAVTLRVLDMDGRVLAEKNLIGRDNLGGSFWNPPAHAKTAIPAAFKANLEAL